MRKITYSEKETREFAERAARKILKKGPGKTATILALQGELGSGKTTFVQGFFKGLGIKSRALSPTFIIFRRHKIPKSASVSKSSKLKAISFSSVFHMDAYRLKTEKELGPLGMKKLLKEPENIFLIEWAENIKKALPKKTIWIKFSHGEKINERSVVFYPDAF